MVDVSAVRIRDDFLPIDRLHVAQVVIVEQYHAPAQNIPKRWQFNRKHFRCRDYQCELLVVVGHLEERPTTNYLQTWKYDAPNIDVRDQNVASHFAYVLEEAQVEIAILEPCQFQVTINVRAVRKSIFQISVVVVTVGRHRPAAVRSNAYSFFNNGLGYQSLAFAKYNEERQAEEKIIHFECSLQFLLPHFTPSFKRARTF